MRSTLFIALLFGAVACGGGQKPDTPDIDVHPNTAIAQAYERLAEDVRTTANDCDAFSDAMYDWIEDDGERVVALARMANDAPRQPAGERIQVSERARTAIATVSHVSYLCQDSPHALGAWRDFEKVVGMQLDGGDAVTAIATR